MKTIGLLGGMGWPSTLEYYSLLNRGIEKRLGPNHSAKCIIYSYDFDEINPNYRSIHGITSQFKIGIEYLQSAQAEMILLCSNTAHKYLDMIRHQYDPDLFLDIRDCVGLFMLNNNLKSCLLLGTKFTMNEFFYKNVLISSYGINVTVPSYEDQITVHNYIFRELVNNKVTDEAITFFKALTGSTDADAVVLGCTELELVFNKIKSKKVLVDTTSVHASFAIDSFIKRPI